MPRLTDDLEFHGMGGGCLERRLRFLSAPAHNAMRQDGWLASQAVSL
jgi:hypothetical protein